MDMKGGKRRKGHSTCVLPTSREMVCYFKGGREREGGGEKRTRPIILNHSFLVKEKRDDPAVRRKGGEKSLLPTLRFMRKYQRVGKKKKKYGCPDGGRKRRETGGGRTFITPIHTVIARKKKKGKLSASLLERKGGKEKPCGHEMEEKGRCQRSPSALRWERGKKQKKLGMVCFDSAISKEREKVAGGGKGGKEGGGLSFACRGHREKEDTR